MTIATQLSQMPTKYAGLRYIPFKSQVLMSSGIISLDAILGGGIPLGTMFLLEEDEFGILSEIIMKYFYAEGLVSKHNLLLASADVNTRNIIFKLPKEVKYEEIDATEEEKNDFKMKIAWRYQSNTEASSVPTSSSLVPNFGHNFDLTTSVYPVEIVSANIALCPQNADYLDEFKYEDVLKRVSAFTNERDGPVRIGIHSLGSPTWPVNHCHLPTFLSALKCLVQNKPTSVALITISPHLIGNEIILKRCKDICDTVISLESLANNSNPIYAEYNALVNIYKYPSINTLSPYLPEANDWALKLHRRKCVIEKLHIPAEVDTGDKKGETSVSSALCHRPAACIDF